MTPEQLKVEIQQLRGLLATNNIEFDLIVSLLDQAEVGKKGSRDISKRLISHFNLK